MAKTYKVTVAFEIRAETAQKAKNMVDKLLIGQTPNNYPGSHQTWISSVREVEKSDG